MEGFFQRPANYTPTSLLERASLVFGNKVSIRYGNTTYTWMQTHKRCLKLASALTKLKISHGDIVAAMAPNIPALYELHFAVPMAGATLSVLNVSLDEPALTNILQRLQPKIIFVDSDIAYLLSNVINTRLQESHHDHKPLLVAIRDVSLDPRTQRDLEVQDYEQILYTGESDFQAMSLADECDHISINFTSATGTPKAVPYSHRAVYLNTVGLILRYDMRKSPVFLWTLDMHRCNGWCFAWTMAELGGVNVFIRNVSAKIMFDSIERHRVTHLCGDHTILDLIVKCPTVDQKPRTSPVHLIISGAIPTNDFVERVQVHGFQIIGGYDTTEALGPAPISPGRSSQHHQRDADDDGRLDDHNLESGEDLPNTTTTSASHVGASPTRRPVPARPISVIVDRSPPTNNARSTTTAGSPQARTSNLSPPGPGHRIASLFQRQKLGKEMLRFAVSMITGLLLNQHKGLTHLQASMVVLALSIGFTATWNGMLLQDMYPRFASALECFGVTSILVAFFGMVSSFLPPILVWACWLCWGLLWLPFLLCLFPLKAVKEREQRRTDEGIVQHEHACRIQQFT